MGMREIVGYFWLSHVVYPRLVEWTGEGKVQGGGNRDGEGGEGRVGLKEK